MLHSPLGRLRVIAFVEGVSYLVLLGVAMPLKHFADLPMAVTIVGSVHGGLFVLLGLAELHVAILRRSILHFLKTFVAAIVPFGTFVLDRSLKREQAEEQATERVPETIAP